MKFACTCQYTWIQNLCLGKQAEAVCHDKYLFRKGWTTTSHLPEEMLQTKCTEPVQHEFILSFYGAQQALLWNYISAVALNEALASLHGTILFRDRSLDLGSLLPLRISLQDWKIIIHVISYQLSKGYSWTLPGVPWIIIYSLQDRLQRRPLSYFDSRSRSTDIRYGFICPHIPFEVSRYPMCPPKSGR